MPINSGGRCHLGDLSPWRSVTLEICHHGDLILKQQRVVNSSMQTCLASHRLYTRKSLDIQNWTFFSLASPSSLSKLEGTRRRYACRLPGKKRGKYKIKAQRPRTPFNAHFSDFLLSPPRTLGVTGEQTSTLVQDRNAGSVNTQETKL